MEPPTMNTYLVVDSPRWCLVLAENLAGAKGAVCRQLSLSTNFACYLLSDHLGRLEGLESEHFRGLIKPQNRLCHSVVVKFLLDDDSAQGARDAVEGFLHGLDVLDYKVDLPVGCMISDSYTPSWRDE